MEVDLALRRRTAHRCRGSRRPRRRVRPRSAVRTCRQLISGRSSLQQIEQIPFGFADATADRGQLDRRCLPGQVPLGLEAADDTPAQRGQHQPPAKRLAVDGRTRGLLRRRDRKLSTLPRPPAPRCSGAPNRQARMQNQARSSYDLADVHQLPVQHGRQSGSVDDEVAHPEVAVHQHAAATARAGGRPASETPTRRWPWCRPCRRGGRATRPAGRRRSGRARPGRRGGWRPAPARTAAAAVRGRCVVERRAGCAGRSSRRRSRRRSGYGLPSAAGELSATRMCGTGAPAAAARCWTAASSSMPACTSSGGPVRRISDRRCCRR